MYYPRYAYVVIEFDCTYNIILTNIFNNVYYVSANELTSCEQICSGSPEMLWDEAHLVRYSRSGTTTATTAGWMGTAYTRAHQYNMYTVTVHTWHYALWFSTEPIHIICIYVHASNTYNIIYTCTYIHIMMQTYIILCMYSLY